MLPKSQKPSETARSVYDKLGLEDSETQSEGPEDDNKSNSVDEIHSVSLFVFLMFCSDKKT